MISLKKWKKEMNIKNDIFIIKYSNKCQITLNTIS
jgi:hypothetical protein